MKKCIFLFLIILVTFISCVSCDNSKEPLLEDETSFETSEYVSEETSAVSEEIKETLSTEPESSEESETAFIEEPETSKVAETREVSSIISSEISIEDFTDEEMLLFDYAAEKMRDYGGNVEYIDFFEFGEDKYLGVTSCTPSGAPNGVFGLRDGELFEPIISCYEAKFGGRVTGFGLNERDELVYLHSVYDFIYAYGSGHSYKTYWLYYDEGARDFREYGGVEITFEEFMTFENAEKIIEEMETYAERKLVNKPFESLDDFFGLTEEEFGSDVAIIFSIYYRGNGVINITFAIPEYVSPDMRVKASTIGVFYMYNATVRSVGREIIVSGDDYIEYDLGYYLPALCPEIAVYPDLEEGSA